MENQADIHYILSTLSNHSKNYGKNYALTSCNHLIHLHCFLQVNKVSRIDASTYDFTCPVCRRASSFIFPLPLLSTIPTAPLSSFLPSTTEKTEFISLLKEQSQQINQQLLTVSFLILILIIRILLLYLIILLQYVSIMIIFMNRNLLRKILMKQLLI